MTHAKTGLSPGCGPARRRPGGAGAEPVTDEVELEPDRDDVRNRDHWLLERLARNTGPKFTRGDVSGSIAFGGRVHTMPNNRGYSWQCEYTLPDVLASDMAAAAAVLAAMGQAAAEPACP